MSLVEGKCANTSVEYMIFCNQKRLTVCKSWRKKNPTAKQTTTPDKVGAGSAADYAAQKAEAAARRKKEKQIAETEAVIARLEEEQKALEEQMSDPAQQTQENFQRYEHIKHEIEQKMYEWEILSE